MAPAFALVVSDVITDYIVSTTKSSYESAASQYVAFAEAYGFEPYPVDAVWLAAWIVFMCTSVKVSSMKVYLAAVQYQQVNQGFPWLLHGNAVIRRVLRWAKRRYPEERVASKLPVTLQLLRRVLPYIDGWPDLARIGHDWRMFVAASVIAVCGFLRGGEFTWHRRSARPQLAGKDVSIGEVDGCPVVRVVVRQPKARWWLVSTSVTCFDFGNSLGAVRLLQAYRSMSTVPLGDDDPAFRTSDGSVLTRDRMVRMTSTLLQTAGVHLTDGLGQHLEVKAASWRAGGLQSAVEANCYTPVIKALGRWTSDAWQNYFSHTLADMRTAAAAIWAASAPSPVSLPVVGVHTSVRPDEDDDNENAVTLAKQRLYSRRADNNATPQKGPPSVSRSSQP